MAKDAKKNTAFISDPQRCGVCDTVLTLYPNNSADCPHCGSRVCRSCWGEAWATKSFSGESCVHLSATNRLGVEAIVGKNRTFQWDWRKVLFIGLLSALAVGILLFLSNLFIF